MSSSWDASCEHPKDVSIRRVYCNHLKTTHIFLPVFVNNPLRQQYAPKMLIWSLILQTFAT